MCRVGLESVFKALVCMGSFGNERQIIGLGANLRYMGYFRSLLHPPGRKLWLLS